MPPQNTQSSCPAIFCLTRTRGPPSPSSRPFLSIPFTSAALHLHISAYTFPSVLPSMILTTSRPRIGRNLKPWPLPPEQTKMFGREGRYVMTKELSILSVYPGTHIQVNKPSLSAIDTCSIRLSALFGLQAIKEPPSPVLLSSGLNHHTGKSGVGVRGLTA